MSTPVGWLCWDGIELVNHARTLSYLRRGLGGPEWTISGRTITPAGGEGYIDDYDDIYDVDPGGPSSFNLRCYCPQTADIVGYIDPETDEAPWFLASRPESAEFLGILLDDLEDRPPVTRSPQRWASGGASMGAKVPTERSAAFTATLVASTPVGMEWGRRWLSEVVGGGFCSDDDSEVRYLPGCPEDPAEETAYRRYARVGLIDPPRFRAMADAPECSVMEARWQIAAGVPWLLSVPDLVATRTLSPGQAWNFQVEADEWNGDKAVLIRIRAGASGSDVRNVFVNAYPMYEGFDCFMDVGAPPTPLPSPCFSFEIDRMPPYSVIDIDSAEEEAIYYNATTKQPESAWPLLTFPGPWSWLTVPACSSVCVTVSMTSPGAGAAQVEVYEIVREA